MKELQKSLLSELQQRLVSYSENGHQNMKYTAKQQRESDNVMIIDNSAYFFIFLALYLTW